MHSSEPAPDPVDDEDAPFLRPSDTSEPKRHGHNGAHEERHGQQGQRRQPNSTVLVSQRLRLRLLVTLFAIVLATELGFGMTDSPLVRIYESITCRKYFLQQDPGKVGPDGQVAEEFCKLKGIQADVAAVKGYGEFFDGILGVLLAIPYGLMADRRGRKATICLSVPAFALYIATTFVVLWFSDTIPLRAVWLSSLAWVIGGGPAVAFAVVWTMVSDVTSEDERASIFFKFGIVMMVGELISTALASWMMAMNPWVPLLLGWGLSLTSMGLVMTLPETINASAPTKHRPETSAVEMGHLSAESDELTERDRDGVSQDNDERVPFTRGPTVTTASKRPLSLLIALYTQCRACFTPYAFIFRNSRILLLLSAFLVFRLSRGSASFVVQYISTRYLWSLAESSFLMSFRNVITIVTLLFVLPGISKHYLRRSSPSQSNLYLARVSVVCLGVGTLGIGLSPNIGCFIASEVVQASGAGFLFLARAVITVLVKQEETARLFIIVELIQGVGGVIGSLAVTSAFQVGLELGGAWVGMAWMVTSTMFALVGVSMWKFRLPPATREREI